MSLAELSSSECWRRQHIERQPRFPDPPLDRYGGESRDLTGFLDPETGEFWLQG
jgi:hypothetical protein